MTASPRATMYLRISLDCASDRLAIDRQRADCLALVTARGYDLVKEYVDQSISVSKKNVARPANEKTVDDYDAGLLDVVVCWDPDRLPLRSCDD